VRLDELVVEVARRDDAIDASVSEPVLVRADKSALERALANLVQNAHAHGPGGRIAVAVFEEKGLAHLSVEDEGSGLRLEEAELAFRRFWRRETSGPGSGLGLAIVRAIAERHGGRVDVSGSRFTIELPALRDLSGSVGRTGADEPEKGSS
jgi:signal transduction histidine kinase